MFSDCVIKATLDHPNCLMSCMIPTTISASLDTVLRKRGNTSVLERRGDDDPGEIYSKFSKNILRICESISNESIRLYVCNCG